MAVAKNEELALLLDSKLRVSSIALSQCEGTATVFMLSCSPAGGHTLAVLSISDDNAGGSNEIPERV
jgi:hypothetical protein